MESLYFKSDLHGLYTEFFNRCGKGDEVFDFLRNCDFIYNFYGKNNLLIKSQNEEIEKRLKNIFKFLIKCYYFDLLYKNDNDRESKLNAFIKKIPRKKISGVNVYNIINSKDIEEAIEEGKGLWELYQSREDIRVKL